VTVKLVHQIEIHTVFKWQVLKAWNEKTKQDKMKQKACHIRKGKLISWLLNDSKA